MFFVSGARWPCLVLLSWESFFPCYCFGHGSSSADGKGVLLLLYCGLVMGVYCCCLEGLVLLSWALASFAAVMGVASPAAAGFGLFAYVGLDCFLLSKQGSG
ncbi:hypothetical protein U1Q18_023513 [Sarracenia purpurea var. burkii]